MRLIARFVAQDKLWDGLAMVLVTGAAFEFHPIAGLVVAALACLVIAHLLKRS